MASTSFVSNFLVLVKAFWEEGKVDEAIQVVRDMEQRGVFGAACVYYELACCLCNNGRWQEALLEVRVFFFLFFVCGYCASFFILGHNIVRNVFSVWKNMCQIYLVNTIYGLGVWLCGLYGIKIKLC